MIFYFLFFSVCKSEAGSECSRFLVRLCPFKLSECSELLNPYISSLTLNCYQHTNLHCKHRSHDTQLPHTLLSKHSVKSLSLKLVEHSSHSWKQGPPSEALNWLQIAL